MNYLQFRQAGFNRVASVVPPVKIADVDANVAAIKNIILDNIRNFISLYLFPELSITGYTCGDLFLQKHLISEAERGVAKLVDFTATLDEHHETNQLSRTLYSSEYLIVVGAPIRFHNHLYNCAIFISKGEILAIIPKIYIPNYGEYYERRWFESGIGLENTEIQYADKLNIPFGTNILIRHGGMTIGAEICEDLWTPNPPSTGLAMSGADVIVNLSASNAAIGKQRYRRNLILQQSARCRCAYLYASAGLGESSTDLAFPGYAAIAEDGEMLAEFNWLEEMDSSALRLLSLRQQDDITAQYSISIADIDITRLQFERIKFNTFSNSFTSSKEILTVSTNAIEYPKLLENDSQKCEADSLLRYPEKETPEIEFMNRSIALMPFVPSDPVHRNENCTEIINIQCHGLLQRLRSIGFPKMIIGVSGGLDSTLALLVAVRTAKIAGMKTSDIIAITMPGLATSNRTHSNAWQLMTLLGCTPLEIPIGKAIDQHFKDIGQDPKKYDATYENSQARERTQILMDYANKTGGIVIGTGDLSELALGWCTYNGDHMSMYAVNASVPKTLVKYLVEWFALKEKNQKIKKILFDIIDTPISPELVPATSGEEDIEQKTEDLVGPYELHDFYLYHTLRNSYPPRKIFLLASEAFKKKYEASNILHWMRIFYRRFFNQQFKRSCLPDGPKVGSVCLSPRGDWRMPSDATAALWLKEIDKLEKEYSF